MLISTFPVVAHENAHDAGAGAPFSLTANSKKTLTAHELADAEASQTRGTLYEDGGTLTYTDSTIRLVVRTGPEDDMMSYRIQGVRNPHLVVPTGAKLQVLFVNTDQDMPHDIHFGPLKPPFPIAPGMQGAVGSSRLPAGGEKKFSAEELRVRTEAVGSYTYYCSVRGHAKSGMYGMISVGAPAQNSEAPVVSSQAPASPPSDPQEHAPAEHSHSAMDANSATGHDHEVEGHDHQNHAHDNVSAGGQPHFDDHGDMSHGDMQQHSMHGMMRSTVDLNDPMTRESSGTSWLPDSSPMYMRMRMKGDKMLMWHGVAFPRYTRMGSDRDVSVGGKGGRSRFDAPTMFMGMYSQPAGKDAQLGLRVMASVDPIIERGYGYPLLYQSGESYRDQPLHDRQHPHDFISELSMTYSHRLGGGKSAYLYLGYPGEPALGPPTFMHRISAMDNPDAPISHHWQDSTHVTFGVVTAGYSTGKLKVEASAFKGEEPNENRYDFDSPRLDSYSARLSWNPTSNLALQISRGNLKRPEPSEPEISSRRRTTASLIYNKPLGDDSNWSNALVWGQNDDKGEGRTNSYLFETSYQRRADTFYARFERAQKSGHELALDGVDEHQVFNVGSYAFGYVRDLKRNNGLDVGLGAQVTFNTNPAALNEYYGGSRHTSFQIFLRLRPSRVKDH